MTDTRVAIDVREFLGARDGTTTEPRASFDDWYASAFDDLVRLAYLIVGSRDIARDLTQDAMVGVFRHWDRIDRPDHYARRAVVNACRSHQRRAVVARRHQPGPMPPAELGAAELTDALAKLSERQRTAVLLRYWADLPESDIAEIIGVRRGSVASLLHRALAELRKVIEP